MGFWKQYHHCQKTYICQTGDIIRMRIMCSVYVCRHVVFPELGRLLTNCNPLLIPDYMTKIVVSYIICYITHFR